MFRAIAEFLRQWDASVDIDPVQHACTAVASVGATLLIHLFWASVRGFV